MKWIKTKDQLPPDGELVLTTIWGSDCLSVREGETIFDAIVRQQREVRYVSVGRYYSEDDEWTGGDRFPSMITPVAWAELPEPYQGEEE